MKYAEEEYDEIWNFLEGNLEDSEKRRVIQRIKSDAIFREEVAKCESLLNNLHYLGGEKFISQLGKEKTPDNFFTIVFRNKKAVRIAAGILVFIAAGFYVWNISQNDQPGIAEGKTGEDSSPHSETPPIPAPPISLEDLLANNLVLPIENAPRKFESAVDKINKNHPQRGIIELQALGRLAESTDSKDRPLFGASGEKPADPGGLSRKEKEYQNLYLGIAYLKSKDYVKAQLHLENAPENKEARWYLALTYLGQKNIEKAIELAGSMAEDKNNPFNGQAEQLKEHLENYEK